jgi:hypothetical protein
MAKLSNEASKDINYQLSYMLPEGKAFSKVPRESIAAKLDGPGFALFFSPTKEKLNIPLNNNPVQQLSQANLSELIRKKLKSSPFRLNVVESAGFEVRLDEEMVKFVPVKLKHLISSATGYKVHNEIQLTPDSISIKGPKKLVRLINFVEVENISHKNHKEKIHEIAKIIPDSTGLLIYSDQEVKIEVTIDPITEKSLILPIETNNDSIKSIPSRAELVFEIGLSEFESFGAANFIIGLKESENSNVEKAKLILIQKPPSIQKFRIRPDSVRLIYETRKGQ